jgi:hypothetical protein
MPAPTDFSYAAFYRAKAVELAEKVKQASDEYAKNPDGTAWCELENRFRDWHETHATWRAMACHKL